LGYHCHSSKGKKFDFLEKVELLDFKKSIA